MRQLDRKDWWNMVLWKLYCMILYEHMIYIRYIYIYTVIIYIHLLNCICFVLMNHLGELVNECEGDHPKNMQSSWNIWLQNEHLASMLIRLILVVCARFARAMSYLTTLWSCEQIFLSTLQITWRIWVIWVWLTHTHTIHPPRLMKRLWLI